MIGWIKTILVSDWLKQNYTNLWLVQVEGAGEEESAGGEEVSEWAGEVEETTSQPLLQRLWKVLQQI